MTSTFTPATLTVTHTESMTLVDSAGTDRTIGEVNTFTIGIVATVVSSIVEVTTSETGLMSFAANTTTAVGGTAFPSGYAVGHFDENDIRYLRITNKDDTNKVELTFKNASDDEFKVIIDAGQSYIYGCDNAAGGVSTMSATDMGAAGALANLEDITAKADTASCDVDVFVASI